ncbi:Protein-glutamine gamma-glutamyltransferase [bacterium HR29]|jgi:hypothetical protein|nr:Protein-glutamine gamma-glutamyltransferase [bacterium HR29]
MAELNLHAQRSLGRRVGAAAVGAPRIFLSWEDWFTLAALAVCALSVAASVQQGEWVTGMPALVPTAVAGLVAGLLAARIRLHWSVLHLAGLLAGGAVVLLAAQSFADGATIADRIADVRFRMVEWYRVVVAGDISTDNLPFVIFVHAATYAGLYVGTWVTFRWYNPWFALIPGGVVLLLNISLIKGQPSAPFFFYLLGGLLLLSRVYLQRLQAQWRRMGVPYPDFVSLNAAQVAVTLTLLFVALAWSVPLGKQASAAKNVALFFVQPFEGLTNDAVRLFSNVNLQFGAGGNFHKFQGVLPIRGNVELGQRVLFEVTGIQGGFLYGTSYDTYTGSGWRATGREQRRLDAGTLPELSSEDIAESRVATTISVTMRSDESTLFFPGAPLASNRNTVMEFSEVHAGDIVQIRSRRVLREGDTYNAVGSVSIATPDQLRSAGAEYPDWVTQRYLQLPADLPESVRREAERVTAGATNPYDAAVALEAYLRQFPFDPSVPAPPPGRDAVEFFLFDLKRGYFDYQASAMAVMLRSIGIPARVAAGYALDPKDQNGATFTVRKDDAYTWVEVYFPGYGWVPFNPTADRPAGSDIAIDPSQVPNLEDFLPLDQLFPEDPLFSDIPGGVGTSLAQPPTNAPAGPPWTLIWALAALVAILAAAATGARLAWGWGLGGLPATAALWAKVQRLGSWAGIRPVHFETPREYAARLGAAVRRPKAATTLAAAYEETRYGRPDLVRADPDETQRSYVRLRNALVKKVLHLRDKSEGGPE